MPVKYLKSKGHGVGADPEIGRMTEREHAAVTEEHIEAHGKERKEGDLDDHVHVSYGKMRGETRG